MKKKIAVLLSIIMIIASMPITAFAGGEQKVYGTFTDFKYNITDSSFSTIIEEDVEGSSITDLKVIECTSYGPLLVKDPSNLKRVIIGSQNYDINSTMFMNYNNLEEVTIEPGIEVIGSYAFYNTQIKEISIPDTVTDVSPYAFINMPKLEKVINNTAKSFELNIGGVTSTLQNESILTTGLRMENDEYLYDKDAQTISIQLKACGNGNEVVSYSLENPGEFSITSDGLLTGPVGDGGYKDIQVNLSTPSIAKLTTTIELYPAALSKPLSATIEGIDSSYVVNECVDKKITLECGSKNTVVTVKDDNGPLLFSDAATEDGNYVPTRIYGNEVIVASGFANTEDIWLYINVGYLFEEAYLLPDAKQVNTDSYTATGAIDSSTKRVAIDVFESFYADVYVVDLEPTQSVNVKVSGTDKNVPVSVMGAIMAVDDNGKVFIDTYGNPDMSVYKYNYDNYNFVGEDIIINNTYAKRDDKIKLAIYVSYDNEDFLGEQYSISIEKSDVLAGFPAPTVDDISLDFSAVPDSMSNDAGKFSWDKDTRTLTLKDGFYLDSSASGEEGITMPENSTINVEGMAYIVVSDYDGIIFNSSQTGTKSNINMAKDSKLTILSDYQGIRFRTNELNITGVPNENGELPIIDITANSEGIETRTRSDFDDSVEIMTLNLKNVKINCLTNQECIELDNGKLVADNIELDFKAYGNEGIFIDAVNTSNNLDENNTAIDIKNSKLKLICEDEGIESEMGGIKLINCQIDINAYRSDEGIWIDEAGDLYVEGGSLDIVSDDECIDVDVNSITIKGTKLNLKTKTPDEYSIMISGGPIDVEGKFAIYDKDGNFVKYASINDYVIENTQDGYFTVGTMDAEGNILYCGEAYNYDTTVIDSQELTLDGLKQEYAANEDVVVRFDVDQAAAEVGDVRYRPASWEVVGTEVKGTIGEDCAEIEVPKENLADGEYTLKITYVAKQIGRDGIWKDVLDDNGNKITKEFTSKFTVDNGNSVAEDEVKSPLTGVDTALAMTSVMMLGLAYTLYTVVRRKKKYSK